MFVDVAEKGGRMPTPTEERKRWQTRAAAGLPSPSEPRRRNADITKRYVSWYLQRPELCKWAGAAAFASRQVGRAIAVHHYASLGGLVGEGALDKLKDALDLPFPLAAAEILDDLKLLKHTNNAVFADIGWAHQAFLAPDGGLQAVEAALADQPTSLLLSGFRKIEAARLQLQTEPVDAAAQDLIWEGNRDLLLHEQREIVQPGLAAMHQGLGRLLTLLTWVDFDPDMASDDSLEVIVAIFRKVEDFLDGRDTATSFLPFLLSEGHHLPAKQPADFTLFEHRWFWVDNSVLPLWRQVDTSTPTLHQRMPILGKLTRI